ncbi:MAG: hypothetical protein AD742_07820 [Methylibium sp. NZG]|nr:MAG: hypothetical protein AD742_07820 [Methylibium sp. NZG]
MTTLTIELPEDIIAQVKADTGKRTARTAVLAALKAYHEERKFEPPTPEQCARQMRKRGPMPLAPELIALGAGKDFLKR